ncbi:Lon protease [Photobacterium jeanii]|uniref:Lon protease n=1 Tax=Photobacterium jeanii TaxID=858640 RepID=A0A178KPC3_9GAMM|nr:LON peptidase substrate-binding domain-containing protein [Photobacterium jeanii]OAN18412.1 Lon protease [Photobacterium jeanii]PST91907.1 Lon protease [Photobacterium jeanii]
MTNLIPLLFQKRHVLPKGKMPMRVAPGSQMAAFKNAITSEQGFGVCMIDDNQASHYSQIGTRVTVEDYDLSKNDGSLIVTLYAHENFVISSLEQHPDGNIYAEHQPLPQWPEIELRDDQQLLADKLQIMFDKYPELAGLHQNKEFNNLSWLCQRWLEILPVPAKDKQALVNTPNCFDTCDYLMSMMTECH